jgi:mono/diheme cytochrome c family protein
LLSSFILIEDDNKNMKISRVVFFLMFIITTVIFAEPIKKSGKKVFEIYCWGCHHQTAEAFGPSFSSIASKRNSQEIQAMISNPDSVSKVLGYKRNAMPAFKLKEDELHAITEYILSFKENK